ncbi:hypothetical protein PCANC_10006 [Puccinia coronata f. sp. avenae]|uniref:Uncharacterized protein n=1 Tax=Puccinia coronata f. sp. avenae TaxID=200324 RepID=A0A2N5T133_9BASI|nr:hypothetical protein PCANC_10006 [Puccinia coronata f. sp. avenae]
MLQNPPVGPSLLAKQAEKEFLYFETNGTTAENTSKKVKKTLNYQEHEDIAICQAWIQVSEDPRVGTCQDGATFWV